MDQEPTDVRPWRALINQGRTVLGQGFVQSTPFGLPETFVRAIITFTFVAAYLYMQWMSPTEGSVPTALVGATSLVTGFYLTSAASSTMKALLSIIYAGAFAAFMARHGWVPEAVNGQTLLVLGLYFGKRTGGQ